MIISFVMIKINGETQEKKLNLAKRRVKIGMSLYKNEENVTVLLKQGARTNLETFDVQTLVNMSSLLGSPHTMHPNQSKSLFLTHSLTHSLIYLSIFVSPCITLLFFV